MDLDAQDSAKGLQGVRPRTRAAPNIAYGVGATRSQQGELAVGNVLLTNQTEKLVSNLHPVMIPQIANNETKAK